MLKILLYIVLVICLIVFIKELMELHKKDKEYEKSLGKDDINLYIEKTFGKGKFVIFKSMSDDEGNLRHTIYLPNYEWFKSPQYQWFEVYATNNSFNHIKIEE